MSELAIVTGLLVPVYLLLLNMRYQMGKMKGRLDQLEG